MNESLTPLLPDFDDPIGVLKACHLRMLAHCGMLEKLVPHIADKGIDEEARGAIGKVKTYFSTSAAHHHQDEEEDLFPLLAHQSLKLAEIIYKLRQQHKQINAAWYELQTSLKQPGDLPENSAFPDQVDTFCQLYREHIEYEESELLIMAQHIISQDQLDELGDKMARRRGVKR